MSFGWGASKPDPYRPGLTNVNQWIVDLDIGGTNFLSLKVSNLSGNQQVIREASLNGTKIQEIGEGDAKVTVHVHRWPRVVFAFGAAYVLFEAGILEAAYAITPVLAERLTATWQQIPQFLQSLQLFVPTTP